MGTTNILDLNNRLTKVEKENVAQNSYTSLKNKPKINSHILTGDKSSSDLGLAAAGDITDINTAIGDMSDLETAATTLVGAIDEINSYVLRKNGNNAIDISTYDYTNQYTFPDDGYVNVVTGSASSGNIDIRMTGNNGVGLAIYKVDSVSPNTINSIYVKRGMKFWVSSNTSNSSIGFRSIS